MQTKKLTDKRIRSLPVTNKTQNISIQDNNGLILVIQSKKKSGHKYFEGRFRFQGKQQSLHLGAFEKQVLLNDVRKKWMEIHSWYWKNECLIHPHLYNKDVKSKYLFIDAVNLFFESKKNVKDVTLNDYKNKIYNQVLPVIGKDTPLKLLEWGSGGRSKIEELLDAFKKRGKFEQERRTRNVLRQIFDLAIQKEMMSKGSNPALKNPIPLEVIPKKNHPSIGWGDVPKLIADVNANACNGAPEVDLAVKFLLMTFLRVGALVRLEWDWYDGEKDCWIIPSQTAGLKRKKGTEDKPHYIPVTEELRELMNTLRELTGHQKYVFFSPRGRRFGHICPDAPNNHLKRLGWKELLVAHGWRSVPLTAGQDNLNISYDIIQRQMGHLLGDRVRQAYDKSQMLDERRDFMNAWTTALATKGLKV